MSVADRGSPAPLAVFTHGELIGDALIKIPFVRALRGLYPDRRIVWITTEESHLATTLRPLMDGLVDEFHGGSGMGSSPLELLRPMPFRDRYSLVLDTQTQLWRTLLARRLRHELFVSPCANFRLSDRRPAAGYRKPRHVVDRLFDLLEVASGRRPVLDGAVSLPQADSDMARALLPDGPIYVAIAPGAGKRVKCWPLDRFIAVAQRQAARGRVPVLILGPAELDWLEPLRTAVPGALFPLQDQRLSGGGSPLRTIAIARRCAAALANDSGISHMFGAADVPLLTLYGPTDAEKLRPKVTRGLTLSARSYGGEAMDVIPVEAVLAALDELLAT
jgi:ADP-heptose:LPS heptosyltransferase